MANSNVVVVESPAKAKTINKYLGKDFEVLASYGHVRDLPAKDGSVKPDDDFAMSWEVDGRAKKRIDDIARACKGAQRLFLATDPDREGEAISWHVQEELRRRKVLNGLDVQRVVFHEITKGAVGRAMEEPRALDEDLIEAYLARRALDYLVGFTLSPVLWRKLPGAKSAGRVQSVALRLICEREAEVEAFRAQEFWTVEAMLEKAADARFTARLTHLDGNKLTKFDLATDADANRAVAAVQGTNFTVASVEKKQAKRHPSPPFTTSTLQQEASRKLYFGATKTMTLAQKLYEGVDIDGETAGLITYMRTDSTTLSQEALTTTRKLISERYGDPYLPHGPRQYRTKAKNAQEAHEAIRPTDVSRHPDRVKAYMEPDMFRLYELIWKRTVASQMESAILDQVAVDLVGADGGRTRLRANGSVIRFDGFLTLYREDVDDPKDDGDDDRRLPQMDEGDAMRTVSVTPNQHFTQPPPRYTEASLVKRMEELGIGRPSTYASILKVLQDREYVQLDKRRFVPEDRGRLVTAFLTSFYEKYFDYDFTADLEERLDDISGGRADWKRVLREFWDAFKTITDAAMELSGQDVRERIDRELGPHFFPADDNGSTEAARKCPSCNDGRLALNFGKFGAFIACSNYPECRYTRNFDQPAEDAANGEAADYPKDLGIDPESGEVISLRQGPYGFYVQRGEAEKDKPKPKRASLLKSMSPGDVDLETALRLLSLPRDLGQHPETKQTILAGMGRFGPYLKHGDAFVSLPAEDDILTIGLNRAVTVIAEAPEKKGAHRAQAKELGPHPADGKPIKVGAGRYGPYVAHGKIFASIPKGTEMDDVTLEQAIELIAAKAEKAGVKIGGKKAASRKTGAKKAKSKKAAGKKTASKKAAGKKAAGKKAAGKKAAGKKAAGKKAAGKKAGARKPASRKAG